MNNVKIFSLCLTLAFSITAHSGMMDEPQVGQILFDKLEASNDNGNPTSWDLQAKLSQNLSAWIWQSEGSHNSGETETENLFLYSTAVRPYWDLQYGLAVDIEDDETITWAALGLSGMAPYFIETDVHLLLKDTGALVKLKFEKEFLFTQKLHLVPEAEIKLASTNMPDIGLGSGLVNITSGIRLKYEISRKLSPYIGVTHSSYYGATKRNVVSTSDKSLVLGINFWF